MKTNLFARQNDFVGLAIIAVLAAALLSGCGTTAVTRSSVHERPDSLIVKRNSVDIQAHSDSLSVEISKPSLPPEDETLRVNNLPLIKSEKINAARSIRAVIDTTVKGIHVQATYQWPSDLWNIKVQVSDTNIYWMVRDSLIEKPYSIEKTPFWVYLALGGMAIALIAVIIKK